MLTRMNLRLLLRHTVQMWIVLLALMLFGVWGAVRLGRAPMCGDVAMSQGDMCIFHNERYARKLVIYPAELCHPGDCLGKEPNGDDVVTYEQRRSSDAEWAGLGIVAGLVGIGTAIWLAPENLKGDRRESQPSPVPVRTPQGRRGNAPARRVWRVDRRGVVTAPDEHPG
jgi:hypothetical protein